MIKIEELMGSTIESSIVKDGDGVPMNKAEAVNYLKKAADCCNIELMV